MSTSLADRQAHREALAHSARPSRLSDFWSMTKPRIGLMTLVVTAIGFSLADAAEWWRILPALLGVGLLGAAASILNQWWEADVDRKMQRTSNRPIPAGRITRNEALLFGLICAGVGTAGLWLFTNTLTAVLAIGTLVVYVGIYTPLKTRTHWCTTIGALPGAMPPVLGWTAASGVLSWEAAFLFAVLFLWQFPHFLAIAWIHQEDYDAAGLKMLPRSTRHPALCGWISATSAAALFSVTFVALGFGLVSGTFAVIASLLGGLYLFRAGQFLRDQNRNTARSVLLTSLAYLPLVLLAFLLDTKLLA